jgi:hypothetical protein
MLYPSAVCVRTSSFPISKQTIIVVCGDTDNGNTYQTSEVLKTSEVFRANLSGVYKLIPYPPYRLQILRRVGI